MGGIRGGKDPMDSRKDAKIAKGGNLLRAYLGWLLDRHAGRLCSM